MKNVFSLLFVAAFLVVLSACSGTQQAAADTADTAVSEESAVAGTFGADFTPEEVVPANTLLTSYSETKLVDTVQITLQGEVNEVCQAKGCWMTIAAGNGEEMMVKFKDYGFFMPKDISGREVVMHGMAYYQITPVDELRHYAEDAGKSEEEIAEITEPKQELRFLADGVKLLPGKM
ncbi:DUF4920 domain-containing protein [Neolewinella aurantiaca]|uniref:DUF4920 domain-containing protein n=1 Tax=Neolewinella aurantiaca TaxID=2602767 RepID=A0A5C7FJA2_9BACT|nr:DUF4920 domain-containing protein [Neolewinella aurantiaca]TXF91355.1 DUF4920 domain-containing protein [Neolewinella aurantiaca]